MVILHHPNARLNNQPLEFEWVELAWEVLAAGNDFVVALRWEVDLISAIC